MTPQTQEALKMAIEWMENPWKSNTIRLDVINACKEALEQPAQETWQAAKCYKIYAKNKDVCNFKITSVKKGDMVYIKPPILNRLSDADIFEELERTDTFTAKSFFAGVRWAEEEFARINGMELSDE